MNKRVASAGLAFGVLALPLLAAAQSQINTIDDIITWIGGTIDLVFGLLVGLGVLAIAWGIFQFILHADDEAARTTGRAAILWGVIGIFVLISIWGLVNILSNTFKLNNLTPRLNSIVPGMPGGPVNTSSSI